MLFRPDDVPKGNINVNVEYGKVVLRGEADSQEMIDELVRRATEIEGARASARSHSQVLHSNSRAEAASGAEAAGVWSDERMSQRKT